MKKVYRDLFEIITKLQLSVLNTHNLITPGKSGTIEMRKSATFSMIK